MSLDTTPLRMIEMQLEHTQRMRSVLVADLHLGYRWLWANRAMALVCVTCGCWSVAAVISINDPGKLLWWVNLVAAVLNFVVAPWNIWRGERTWARQMRDTAMLPTAIGAMKRARQIALECPRLAPTPLPVPCAYCQGAGLTECPFKTAEAMLVQLHAAAK